MSRHLLEPVTDQGIRSIKFFNGRMLPAEDLSQEQMANEARRRQLGRAVGDGIACGFEISRKDARIITVESGLAFNRLGQAVALGLRTDIDLVTAADEVIFSNACCQHQDCEGTASGLYVAGQGVYILLVSPTSTADGRAEMSGLGNDPAKCNARYCVEGVQFRLQQVTGVAELTDLTFLRNRIAYRCFGYLWQEASPLAVTACGGVPETYGLIDTLRRKTITCCEVPLAILYLTATDGIVFIDHYSVRRRLTHVAVSHAWNTIVGDRRASEGESIFLQFSEQLKDVTNESSLNLSNFEATQRFKFLPAAGYLPVGTSGFDWGRFLGPLGPAKETQVNASLLRAILHQSFFEDPILLDATPKPAISVYRDPFQTDCVLFARSWKGRIRVKLNPVPSSVDIYAIQGSCTTHNCPFVGTDPAIIDLWPGDYDVIVTASGYQAVAAQSATIIGGEQVELTFTLTPQPSPPPPPTEPPKCVKVKATDSAIRGGRFCQIKKIVVKKPKASNIATGKNEIGYPTLGHFVKVKDPEVQKWVEQWRKVVEKAEKTNLSKTVPAVYLYDRYKPPKEISDVPIEPQAYAVFGDLVALPLLINDSQNQTRLPVSLTKSAPQGLTDTQIQKLVTYGITDLDHLSGACADMVMVALGKSQEYAATLILDAYDMVRKINQSMDYYPGIDDNTKKVLAERKIVDDVGLANANYEVLGPDLASEGYAYRLIEDARKVAPPESWSLDELGFSDGQIGELDKIGVRSQGDLANDAADKASAKKVRDVLGITSDSLLNLRTSAITNMTVGALSLKPEVDLIALPGVNGVIAEKLAAVSINSTSALASASPEDLAKNTELPLAMINNLIASAKAADRARLDVSALATSSESARILKEKFGVSTITDLAGKSAIEVAGAFGGDKVKAGAVIQGIKLALRGDRE